MKATTKKADRNPRTLRDGDVFLFVEPHYWGKATTPRAAVTQSLRVGGLGFGARQWRLYSAHPDTFMDEIGYINFPAGHAPIVISEHQV